MFLEPIWNHPSRYRGCYFGHSMSILTLILDYSYQEMHQFSVRKASFHLKWNFPNFSIFLLVPHVHCALCHCIFQYTWDRSAISLSPTCFLVGDIFWTINYTKFFNNAILDHWELRLNWVPSTKIKNTLKSLKYFRLPII